MKNNLYKKKFAGSRGPRSSYAGVALSRPAVAPRRSRRRSSGEGISGAAIKV